MVSQVVSVQAEDENDCSEHEQREQGESQNEVEPGSKDIGGMTHKRGVEGDNPDRSRITIETQQDVYQWFDQDVEPFLQAWEASVDPNWKAWSIERQ